MFRPTPQRSLLGYVPIRLAASVFALFVLLLGIAILVGIQYERSRLLGTATADVFGPRAWLTVRWEDARKIVIALGVLAAVGILFLTTVLNYRAITHTFERVKSLMRNILQSIPTGVLTLDLLGEITSFNSAAERLLGLRASVVVGRPVEDVLHLVPDLVAWIRDALRGERFFQETDLLLTLSDGRRVTVRASASDLRDDSGQSDGLVILLRDVTEVNRLEMQLRRADKLAALGTLAAGVAHEVKNPLQGLGLNLHLLEVEVAAVQPLSAEVKGYVEILRSEVKRIHRIVENFLRFSKPSMPEVKPLDLNALLERVLSLVAYEAADHGVAIETIFEPALSSVPGDEGLLSQVYLNLTINALQAMPAGGTLGVASRRGEGWAEVSVRDSGEGIQGGILPHIFDPYFTTRPRGVGLGLAIAHRIVEGHRGTIDVESEIGKGTTMIVRLPLSDPAAERRQG